MTLTFEIRQFGDPVLKTRVREVAEFDGTLKRLTRKMLETLRAGEGRMAIAANQVGVLKRVFVAEAETGPEGCLSIPGVGVEVERHSGGSSPTGTRRGGR